MSERCSWIGWLHDHVVLVLVCVLVLGLLLVGCESDYARRDLDLGWDQYGMMALVEPDEPFEVGLRGNGAYLDAVWQIVEMDSEVIGLRDTEYIPARQEGDWYSHAEGGFLPYTIHWFIGRALGESQLVLEIHVDGQVVDRYKVTISVVEDACDMPIPPDMPEDIPGIINANRCEG